MNDQQKWLANLIKLTLLYIAEGKRVNNKIEAIRRSVQSGVMVLPDAYNAVSHVKYDLQARSSRSPYWPKANTYMKLWKAISNEGRAHSFAVRSGKTL